VKHYNKLIRDWLFTQELSNQGADIVDYYRGLYCILCEECLYSVTMILFLPEYWY